MTIETVLAHLKAAAAERTRSGETAPPASFITISRQAGAGGSSLARLLAEKLSKDEGRPWHVFDRELCETVANDERLSATLENLMREVYRSAFEDYMAQFILDDSPQVAIVKRMFETVRAAAATGQAIIVGRAASLVTRGLPLGVHVRLVGPRPARLERMSKRLGLTTKQAEREAELQDASRKRLIKDYFGRDIEDPLLYDAIWNSTNVPLETIADLTARLVKERARQAKQTAAA